MEDRKEIVNRYTLKGMKATKEAQIAGFSRSGYYYRPNGRKPKERPIGPTTKEDEPR